MSEETKLLVHDKLNEFLCGYIPVQEITHAANEICNDPTDETMDAMAAYLGQADKEFVPLQTANTKAITNNQVRYGMSEVRKIIASALAE